MHDLILFPVYSILGRLAGGALVGGERRDALRIAALNHLRIPALLSGLALVVWFPLILGLRDSTFAALTGLSNDIYPRALAGADGGPLRRLRDPARRARAQADELRRA